MGRVVVLGSINSDLVVTVARLPRPGETVLGGTFAVHGGGKGANQAMAAARAGAPVVMVGGVGDDAYGAERLSDLRREGIDTSGIQTFAGLASGVALIGVDAAGENVILVASGANHAVTPAMADGVAFAAGDVLLQQLEIPLGAVAAGLRAARRAGVPTLLNAAPWDPAVIPLLPEVDLLIVNEIEAADILDRPISAFNRDLLTALAARGPRQVVVTLGGQGVVVWDGQAAHHLPALPVTPVDTTGAGDCFCGVLAAGLALGRPLHDAARSGIVAGGLAVTRAGAQSSLPRRAEIEAALDRLPAEP